MAKKMHTYSFAYDDEKDEFGSVRFCAESRTEAKRLFYEFQKENNFVVPDDKLKVERVYDESDAAYYGKENYS